MSDSPKRYFERFIFWGSFLAMFVILKFVFWIHNTNKLAITEQNMASHFKKFKTYEQDIYLPSTKIAGPNGKIIDLKKNDGKYTVLNIWATWCTPCVKELPSLKKLNKALPYNSGWRIIAVSIDAKNNLKKLTTHTKRYNVEKIANYYDYNLELQKNVNIKNLPMTLIISKSGKILYEIYGEANWQDKEIIAFLNLVEKVH